MVGISLVTIGKSIKSSFNHSISVLADSSATSFVSIVDLFKIVCLWDIYETATTSIVNIYPFVPLISYASEIQLESLYSSSTTGYPVYWSPYVEVHLKYLITRSSAHQWSLLELKVNRLILFIKNEISCTSKIHERINNLGVYQLIPYPLFLRSLKLGSYDVGDVLESKYPKRFIMFSA
jgi:hypothetical protein